MRTLILAVALLLCVSDVRACDVCGCSIGGNYYGILPQFHRHFVGLRWSEQTSFSAHSQSKLKNGGYDTEERFQTLDLLTRFYPVKRVQMLVLAPLHDFRQWESDTYTHTRGIGDVSIMANYVLYDTGDSMRYKWKQTFTLGGGIKLPSGQFRLHNSNGELYHPNLQPGTGSTDFMVSANYTIRRGRWGLSANSTARYNTANRNQFRYGHRLNGGFNLFYWKNIRRVILLPNIGVFVDASQSSKDKNESVEGSGGTIGLATFGLDAYFGRVSTGLTYQKPMYQNLGEGRVDSKPRLMATINYIF
ncbi:MAG: hypothetical protein NW218_12015 [Saprospiraceae bacterium]|nr:hypothetical protein [Saprospiraceae bacterium]